MKATGRTMVVWDKPPAASDAAKMVGDAGVVAVMEGLVGVLIRVGRTR